MKPLDIVILCLIAIALFLAIRAAFKRKCGCCSSCKNCRKCENKNK